MDIISFGADNILQREPQRVEYLPVGAVSPARGGRIGKCDTAEGLIAGRDPDGAVGGNPFTGIAPCARGKRFHGEFLRFAGTGEVTLRRAGAAVRPFGRRGGVVQVARVDVSRAAPTRTDLPGRKIGHEARHKRDHGISRVVETGSGICAACADRLLARAVAGGAGWSATRSPARRPRSTPRCPRRSRRGCRSSPTRCARPARSAPVPMSAAS